MGGRLDSAVARRVLRCGIPLRRHGSRLSAVRAGNILGAMPLPGRRAVLAVRDATRAGSPGQARRTGGWEMAGQPFGGAGGASPPENYQRFFVPAIGAPLAADLVRNAALREGERVLDVACGTGVVTRLASEQVGATGAVAGLAVNPGMLAVARAATPEGMSIEWHEANPEAIPLTAASFDVVLCKLGLQFIPDSQAAPRQVRRVLVDGGRRALHMPGPLPQIFDVTG